MNQHTWGGGWGNLTYWNAYVANLQMHGQGVFYDRRLMNKEQYPVAAKAGYGNMRAAEDKVTAHLAALEFYQLAIPAPAPPEGSLDKAAAARGRKTQSALRWSLRTDSQIIARWGCYVKGNSRDSAFKNVDFFVFKDFKWKERFNSPRITPLAPLHRLK